MKDDEYIMGWRQLKAIFYFFECLFRLDLSLKDKFSCAKRELEIISGFAKPYKLFFHPDFWEDCRRLGMNEDDIDELKRKYENR